MAGFSKVEKVAQKAMHSGAWLLAACACWNEGGAYSWIDSRDLQHRWIFATQFEL